MGTTEFVIAGLLITAFAVGVIIGGPTMAMATLRLPQRRTLILASLALIVLSSHPVAATALVLLMALAGFTVNPVVASLAVSGGPRATLIVARPRWENTA